MKQVECNKCGCYFDVEDNAEWGYCPFCENDQVEVPKRFEEFGTKDYLAIKDNEEMPHLLNQYQCVVRLNEFVDKVKKLENELIGRKKLCDLRYEQLKHAHQDKILFCIEQLEKLKKTDVVCMNRNGNVYILGNSLNEVIDNQIAELKKGILDE